MPALVLQGVVQCLHLLNRLSSYACIGFIETGSKSALVLELPNACNDDRDCRCMNTSIGFIEWVIECMHVLLSLHAVESRGPFTHNHGMLALALLSNDIQAFHIHSFYEFFKKFCIFFGKVKKSIALSPVACAFVIKIIASLNKNKK